MSNQEIMKKSGLLIAGTFLFIFSIGMNAQTKTGIDFFDGKWNVIIKSAPQGDVRMVINFEKINEVVSASIKDSTEKELYKVTNTDINQDQDVITFTGSLGDVPLTLRKKDETSLEGDITGMFDIEGKRISKNK